MNYYYKDNEILTKEDWKNAFISAYNGKENDIHWRAGRSGECLADDFKGIKASGEKTMIDMIRICLNTSDVELEKGYIEYPSVFDNHPRPRMQDLAIWGKANGKRFFIGVEAKVDERFGSKNISEQRDLANKTILENKNTETAKRLDELVEDFLEGNEKDNGNLRYQLLYYLAGSIRESNTDVIFMPVIVYKTRAKEYGLYSDKKGNTNHKDYVNFMKALKFEEITNNPDNEIKEIFSLVSTKNLDGFNL